MKPIKDIGLLLLAAVTFPIWFPLLLIGGIIFGALYFFNGIRLRSKFESKWGKTGRRILFVYSESPNWKTYIETTILPQLEPHVVTLNWSNKNDWKINPPLEAKVLQHWGGNKEFNPIAIVFPRKGKISTIRFWQAFKDAKHGNRGTLEKSENELFTLLKQIQHA